MSAVGQTFHAAGHDNLIGGETGQYFNIGTVIGSRPHSTALDGAVVLRDKDRRIRSIPIAAKGTVSASWLRFDWKLTPPYVCGSKSPERLSTCQSTLRIAAGSESGGVIWAIVAIKVWRSPRLPAA